MYLCREFGANAGRLHPTMAPIEGVSTTKAPRPLPQFSQAVKYNGMVYCSGSIGIDPATSKVVEGTVKDRTVCSLPQSYLSGGVDAYTFVETGSAKPHGSS